MIRRIKYQNLEWLNVSNLDKKDLEKLQKEFSFHPLDLDDCLSRMQRPKVDSYENYVFLIVHFPLFNHRTQKLTTTEINVFIGRDFLVTVHKESFQKIDSLFEACLKDKQKTKDLLTASSGRLLYEILDRLVDYCFPIVDQIGKEIDYIDSQIFVTKAKKTVENISRVRRNIIYFQTMIKPQVSLFEGLEGGKIELLNKDLKDYWGDILDHLKRLWDQLEDSRELLEGISSANESILSYRINEIMKVLTIFSVIMLPLTLLASVYGMNIRLPFMYDTRAFPIIAAIMVFLAILMFLYFKLRHWI